jgi:mandelamide amidase
MSKKKLTVIEIQYQMSQGLLTSEKMLADALISIDKHTDRHAFITVDRTGALSQAKHYDQLRTKGEIIGPLHGIIVAVKDNIHVAGIYNTAGTLALKDFIPSKDATVIKRLKEAGAIIIGKTNMHELAYGITSDNKLFGSVGNAVAGTFIAGGSSGGTATAVALNMASIGLGTDTGGSVRIPASLNGLVGFRPSASRYPSEGLTGISHTRDTVGPIVNSIVDAQILDGILSGETEKYEEVALDNLRIGVPREYFYDNLEPVIAEKTEILLNSLKQAGVELVYSDLESIGEINEQIGFPVVLYETKELLSTYIHENIPTETLDSLAEKISDPGVKDVIDMARKGIITKEAYEKVMHKFRPELQELYRHYYSQHNLDAIIFPTTPLSARPIEGSGETVELNGLQVPTFPTYIHNTDPASNAGIPGLSIPLSVTDDGLPFGIEIDGPIGSDQRILAIGLQIEKLINSKIK